MPNTSTELQALADALHKLCKDDRNGGGMSLDELMKEAGAIFDSAMKARFLAGRKFAELRDLIARKPGRAYPHDPVTKCARWLYDRDLLPDTGRLPAGFYPWTFLPALADFMRSWRTDADHIPALDKKSGEWVKASEAADLDGVTMDTLKTYRNSGRTFEDGLSGIDQGERVWRKLVATAHPWYLKSSLRSAPNRK